MVCKGSKSHFILIQFLLLFVISVPAQTSSVKLSAKHKAEIVNSISGLLKANYVYYDTAVKMSNLLQQQLKRGAYNNINDAVDFSDQLNRDLYSVYHDGHLLVQYNPALADRLSGKTLVTATKVSKRTNRVLNANYGFNKVEILNGNIGYIKLSNLWATKESGGEVIKSALIFVRNTNALIIDLRDCVGGSQEASTQLVSYFLKDKTLLEIFYDRAENETTEYWTEPDSSISELKNIPLYLLTSNKTFSASEMLAYDLQSFKRATVIGETTGGGAHGTFEQPATNGFVVFIPYWRGINTVTKKNWEKVGVKPDIEVAADKSLEIAELKIFERMISEVEDSTELFNLKWQMDFIKAAHHPVQIDTTTLKKFAGIYGERVFTFENGKLFYQRTGRPKFELQPITNAIMNGKGNTYFKIEFIPNEKGEYTEVKAYYQDNRVESSKRTK